MPLLKGTHPVRIYRAFKTRAHDLSVSVSQVDVSGVDVWALVKPSPSELIDVLPGSQPALRTVELWLSSVYDLDHNYIVQVRRPKVYEGARSAVSALLTEDAVVGASELLVSNTIGFRSGDLCLVDGDTPEFAKVRQVSAAALSLNLYEDSVLRNSHSGGAEVSPSRFYRVTSIRVPEDIGPYRVATLVETTLTELSVS